MSRDNIQELLKPEIYPVITLYQPWATWVADELKLIESRTHNKFGCLLKKTILIHAGQNTDKSALPNPYLNGRSYSKPINGVILCRTFVNRFGKLSGIHSEMAMIDCNTVDRFGLYLTDTKKLEQPIPEKGEMGIWYYDLANKVKVRKPDNLNADLFSTPTDYLNPPPQPKG